MKLNASNFMVLSLFYKARGWTYFRPHYFVTFEEYTSENLLCHHHHHHHHNHVLYLNTIRSMLVAGGDRRAGARGGRREKRGRESQGGGNWEELRKISQHFVIFFTE